MASAVDRLRPENVTVVDADSNTPLLHNRDGASRAYGLDEELAKTLVHTLEPVVGRTMSAPACTSNTTWAPAKIPQETYDPKTAATLTQEHSEENSSGARARRSSRDGQQCALRRSRRPPTPALRRGQQSSSRSEATTYAVSKTLHHSVEPPGRVRRIAAAVLVDDAVETTEQAGKRPPRGASAPPKR